MICVSCPIKQDFIIELLEKYDGEDCQFKFVEKKGIKMQFSVNIEEKDKAIAAAKRIIKATEIGSVLYFQVTEE